MTTRMTTMLLAGGALATGALVRRARSGSAEERGDLSASAGLHFVVFAFLTLQRLVTLAAQRP